MDDSGQRGNGRHKADQYKSVHTQWMIPQHHLKDNHAIKLMAIMYERDSAIQERNTALAEKKAAMAERDMAIIQRDAAIAERNSVVMERDDALAALEYARGGNGTNVNTIPALHRSKDIDHHHHNLQPFDRSREMHAADAYPVSAAPEDSRKDRKVKRPRKETTKKTKSRKGEDLNKPATYYVKPLNDWSEGAQNKQGTKLLNEWKDQGLGLNRVAFDESTMPAPVCSCTGKYQQCYKWGNGGWQSACCTTTLSMHPLPVMPNKRHSRVGGRKMSGSLFVRLLSRLAADGHDLSLPVDLKDHWAKHGTNRYITIK